MKDIEKALKAQYDQMFGADTEGQRFYERYQKGESRRINFRDNWQDLTNYLLPRKDDVYSTAMEGEKKNLDIYDSNPIKYVRKLVNNLLVLMVNPSQKWFGFTTGDREIDKDPEVSEYYSKATKVILDEMGKSNFYLKSAEYLTDLIVLGTGVQTLEHDTDGKKRDSIYHFDATPCHKVTIVTDEKERSIYAYTQYKMTALQIVLKFGTNLLNDPINEFLKTAFLKSQQTTFKLIYGVELYSEIFHGKIKGGKKPFVGMHILEQNKYVLKKEGFHENPYQISRWTKLSDEEYGRGPGMDALPDIMTLNSMKELDLQSSQLVMAPPVQGTENSIVGAANMIPFGITFRRPGSDPLTPIYPSIRLDISDAKIKDLREDIKEHFFYNQMNLIEKDRMTAVETVQRKDENLREVGSIMIRLDKEWLKPTIERAFAIAVREGEIGAPPEIISKKKLRVRYTSPIAKSLETEGADNFTRAIQASSPAIQSDPTIMDNINGDEVVRDNMTKFDVNPKYLRKPTDVKGMRDQRAQAQADAQSTADQNTDADTLNKLQGQ